MFARFVASFFVLHGNSHGFFGQWLPDGCPTSRIFLKISRFFAIFEPAYLQWFEGISTKTEGKKPVLLDFLPSLRYSIIHQRRPTSIQREGLENRLSFAAHGSSNLPPSAIRNKCEPDPDVYRRGSVRICFRILGCFLCLLGFTQIIFEP